MVSIILRIYQLFVFDFVVLRVVAFVIRDKFVKQKKVGRQD